MESRTKLAWLIAAGGIAGVLSILLVDIDALVRLLPAEHIPPGGINHPLVRIASLIQPVALVAVAVLTGHFLAPRVGLTAPLLEALLARRPMEGAGARLFAGLLGGLIGGSVIIIGSAILQPHFPTGSAARLREFLSAVPPATRLLYGGITEEVLLRWGVMTFFTWAAWRMFQRREAMPTRGNFVAANLLAAVLFAAGHLPVAYLVVPHPNLALITFVMVANMSVGVVSGLLFWKRGLESAVIAHVCTHLVLLTASRLNVYFG